MSHDNVFLKVLLFIEMFNSRLLKKQTLDEKTEEVMRLVLQDLQTGLQAPTATFENILICLSFCTRFHVRTLKKGQEEGLALQVTRSLLAKIVQLNSNLPRTTKLMTNYLSKYENFVLSCVAGHHVFKNFHSIGREIMFQREEWRTELIKFLQLKQPVLGVKSLVCMTASRVKSAGNVDTNLLDLPDEMHQLLNLH